MAAGRHGRRSCDQPSSCWKCFSLCFRSGPQGTKRLIPGLISQLQAAYNYDLSLQRSAAFRRIKEITPYQSKRYPSESAQAEIDDLRRENQRLRDRLDAETRRAEIFCARLEIELKEALQRAANAAGYANDGIDVPKDLNSKEERSGGFAPDVCRFESPCRDQGVDSLSRNPGNLSQPDLSTAAQSSFTDPGEPLPDILEWSSQPDEPTRSSLTRTKGFVADDFALASSTPAATCVMGVTGNNGNASKQPLIGLCTSDSSGRDEPIACTARDAKGRSPEIVGKSCFPDRGSPMNSNPIGLSRALEHSGAQESLGLGEDISAPFSNSQDSPSGELVTFSSPPASLPPSEDVSPSTPSKRAFTLLRSSNAGSSKRPRHNERSSRELATQDFEIPSKGSVDQQETLCVTKEPRIRATINERVAERGKKPEETENTNDVGYRYVDVVRKRTERKALTAATCAQCEKFYGLVQGGTRAPRIHGCLHRSVADASTWSDAEHSGDSGVDRHTGTAEHVQRVSRHRYRHLPPSTPEDYWNTGFPDSDRVAL